MKSVIYLLKEWDYGGQWWYVGFTYDEEKANSWIAEATNRSWDELEEFGE